MSSVPVGDEPYPSINVLVAVVLTLAAPFISLIAALVLLQDQRAEARRSQLKAWAAASGAWLAIGGLIFIGVVASMGGPGGPGGPDSSGPCRGGIDRLAMPTYESSDGHHWTEIYPCVNGGTLRRPARGFN